MQSCGWCWTLNNYTGDEEKAIGHSIDSRGGPKYVVFGREKGESGTPHLQGYVEFERRVRLNTVKRYIGQRAHVEYRKGTMEEAVEYCKKDGDFIELGKPKDRKPGRRTDLERVVGELRDGKRLREIALAEPELYCRYRNGLRDISRFSERPRDSAPMVLFLWGLPGTGKSKFAYEYCPESTWSYGGDGWFDGYDGQRVAIFDDFADDCASPGERKISYALFLKLLDRYPLQVPIKGGFANWRPEVIIITSNRELDRLYLGHAAYVWEAVRRRVTEIKEIV